MIDISPVFPSLEIRRKLAALCLGGPLVWLPIGQANAFELDFGKDSEVSGNLDITLGYAAAIRATDANAADVDPNNNLANGGSTPNYLSEARVPNAGDLISNVFKGSAGLGLDWRNYGFVGYVTYQYDTEIMNGDAIDFNGNKTSWTKAAKDYSGNYLDVLDAYAYGSFDVGDNPLDLRLGKQVINWGEGLYFLDGVSIQVPLNINKLVTPGSELKEAYIGVESLYAQMGIGMNSSLAAYAHGKWRRTEFPPRGTFYGDDAFFRGGTEVDPVLGLPMRDPDIEARDSGQWGIAGRTFITDDTEVGLYYSRYHETFPFIKWTGGNSFFGASQFWPEDLDMFGTSFATTLGSWSLNGELAYRPNRPLFTQLGIVNGAGEGAEEHDTATASVHGIWLGGALPFGIDSQVALVQFGMDYIAGDLRNLQANSSITKETLSPDRLAYGIAGEWNGTWQGIYPGTDLTLGLFLQKDLHGNSHFWGNFAENRLLGTLSLTANIGNAWEAQAGYTWINQNNSHYETQDVVNLSVNYKF